MSDTAALRQLVKRYFADRHVTLWGRSFEIIGAKGSAEAEEWLTEVLVELGSLVDTEAA